MSHTCSLTENKSGGTITYHVSCNPKHKANTNAPSAQNASSAPNASSASSANTSARSASSASVSKPIAAPSAPPTPLFTIVQPASNPASSAVSAPPPHDVLDEEKRTLDAMIAEMQAYFQQNMKNKNKEEIKPLRDELKTVWHPRIKRQRDIVIQMIKSTSSDQNEEIKSIEQKITRVISDIYQLLNTAHGGRRTKHTKRKHTKRKHTKRKQTTRRMIFHR